jgi:hypothetical protein
MFRNMVKEEEDMKPNQVKQKKENNIVVEEFLDVLIEEEVVEILIELLNILKHYNQKMKTN